MNETRMENQAQTFLALQLPHEYIAYAAPATHITPQIQALPATSMMKSSEILAKRTIWLKVYININHG